MRLIKSVACWILSSIELKRVTNVIFQRTNIKSAENRSVCLLNLNNCGK